MVRNPGQSLCAVIGAIVILAVCIATFCRAADEEPTEEAPNDQSPLAEPSDSPQRVIVLTTGRVVLGDVVERPGGYLVREQFGSVVVPFTQVRLTAESLPDAYSKLRRSMVEPTAGKHLDLAMWCFNNRLYSSAQMEIKECLLLEPERKDARELLRKVRRTLETGVHAGNISSGGSVKVTSAGGAFPGQAWKAHARRQEQLKIGGSVSVAGLSPESVHQFVKEIQPLLMNKCGNARCHGQAAENDFQLMPVRHGMSGFRIFTENNLSSVLQEIDTRKPDDSPLLQAVQGLHGGSPRPLLVGAFAERQQASLREWVLRAAVESNRRNLVQGPEPTAEDIRPIENEEPAVTRAATPASDPFFEQILAEERPDRFDPEVFNRMVHGSN